MSSADLQDLEQAIRLLQGFREKASRQSPQATGSARVQDFLRSGDPNKLLEPGVRAFVGLSMGAHEEVADANYRRQECRFIFNHQKQVWVNENAVHFPPAAAAYGCDAILIDGLDVYARMVARMGSPIMLGPGNASGYLPGSLSVLPDIMRMATWRDVQPGAPKPADTLYDRPMAQWNVEPVAPSVPPMPPVVVPVAKGASGGVTDLLKSHYPAMNAQAIRRSVEQLMNPPAAAPIAVVPPAKICERCERVTLPRRNQLAALGYQGSHLVETPDGDYALPCATCRKS